MLTSLLARAEYKAMNPADLPISLTSPTPYSQPLASTSAETIAFWASYNMKMNLLFITSTAVSKPKEESITAISLSIVLGIPTTAILSFLLLISSNKALIPL